MQVNTIAEQFFFTTTRIDTVTTAGVRGSGTGFFLQHKHNDKDYLFIVTNKHVVIGMQEWQFTFLKEKEKLPALGEKFSLNVRIQDFPNMWFGHPDPSIDIAICSLVPIMQFAKEQHSADLFLRTVDTAYIPTNAQLEELDALESVTFIGYPNGVWDNKNLLPIARRGTTASPLDVDFNGTPCFIIDASVFGGSSGSPVFIFDKVWNSKRDNSMMMGTRLFFIGVIAKVFYRTSLNEIIAVTIPTQIQSMAQQQEMIDLGVVFKARTVVETIEAFLNAHGIGTSTPETEMPA